jgi:RimJ/RimL family protein N-acetyltransferase
MKPPETFQTERLLLRKPRLDDAPVIFESYARDPGSDALPGLETA